MIELTNKHNIPLPLAAWLLDDDYDYNPDPKTFSASQLIKSSKKTILSSAVATSPNIKVTMDVTSKFAASRGQTIHAAIERACRQDHITKVAKRLGMQVPKLEAEERLKAEIEVDGEIYTVTGKFDAAIDNIVTDWKNESVFAYLDKGKYLERKYQLSLYAWLGYKNGKGWDTALGHYYSVYQDWKEKEAVKRGVDSYPPSPMHLTEVTLFSFPSLENWIKSVIRERRDLTIEDADSTLCSPKDLWQREPVYQYFSKPDAARASKNFDNPTEATAYLVSKGNKGIIKPKPSYAKACEYCLGNAICSQYQTLLAQGLIENESNAVSLRPSFGEDS